MQFNKNDADGLAIMSCMFLVTIGLFITFFTEGNLNFYFQ
jgi:hypothetical protein